MKLSHRVAAILVAILTCSMALSQTGNINASTLINETVADRFEKQGGASKDLWKRPWRIVILFNSSQASFKSAYTNSVLENVRSFLSERNQDGQPHRVWFYAYQLDLYTGKVDSVVDMPLNADTVHQIEKVFPRIPFKTMADGVTPYPVRGGHSNIGARQQVSKIIAKSATPTLILQFTDVIIGEAPGQDNDEMVRGADQRPRGTEEAGLVVYDTRVAQLESGVASQKYSVLIYGPSDFSSQAASSFPLLQIIVIVGALIAIAVAFFAARTLFPSPNFGAKWSVTFPSSSAMSLERGGIITVYGPGSKPLPTENFVTLEGDDIPAAKLFELEWDKSGVRVIDRLWEVRTSTADPTIVLNSESRITCKDKTNGTSRFLIIKISKI